MTVPARSRTVSVWNVKVLDCHSLRDFKRGSRGVTGADEGGTGSALGSHRRSWTLLSPVRVEGRVKEPSRVERRVLGLSPAPKTVLRAPLVEDTAGLRRRTVPVLLAPSTSPSVRGDLVAGPDTPGPTSRPRLLPTPRPSLPVLLPTIHSRLTPDTEGTPRDPSLQDLLKVGSPTKGGPGTLRIVGHLTWPFVGIPL